MDTGTEIPKQPTETDTLFDIPSDWQEQWRGMPEFVQERQREYAKIIVRFKTKEDLEDFARLIGQRLNRKSQCTWHPDPVKAVRRKYVNGT